MTKRELFELLADVPDEATVYITGGFGADIRVVVRPRDRHPVIFDDFVLLSEEEHVFDESRFEFLHNVFAELRESDAPDASDVTAEV